MKTLISVRFVFGFILLWAGEIGLKSLSRASMEAGAVLYVRSVEKDFSKKKILSKQTNYRKLVEDIDPNGA